MPYQTLVDTIPSGTIVNNRRAGEILPGTVGSLGSIGSVGTIGTAPQYTGSLGAALVPNAPGLEALSSADIADLLNPPSVFPDVSRQAGELAAARGIPGTAAAAGTGLRMTDEERLRRIALGENLLTGAYGRTLPYAVTPNQQAGIDLNWARLGLDQERLALEAQNAAAARAAGNVPTVRYGGGLPQYPSTGSTSTGGGSAPFWQYTGAPITDFHGTGATLAYDTGWMPNSEYNPPITDLGTPNWGLTGGTTYSGPFGPNEPYYGGGGPDYELPAGDSGYSYDPYLDWIYGG